MAEVFGQITASETARRPQGVDAQHRITVGKVPAQHRDHRLIEMRRRVVRHVAEDHERIAPQPTRFAVGQVPASETLDQCRVVGVEKARTQMLEYTRFDREPFPAIYEMLAGKKTGAEVLAEMEKKSLGENALVMFFAHYYIGLNEDLLGHKEAARDHLAKAVALAFKANARGGPGYMGQVARLHYEAMVGK